ncbi:hypothetical protein GQR58_016518 [Nymphon striatum]|nr:hypothetical protein GQR58_016518 [Nymphon striatum]
MIVSTRSLIFKNQFAVKEQTFQNEESMVRSKIANFSNSYMMGDHRLKDMEIKINEAELKYFDFQLHNQIETNRQYEIDGNQFLEKAVEATRKNFKKIEVQRKHYVDTCGKFVQFISENQPKFPTKEEIEILSNQ